MSVLSRYFVAQTSVVWPRPGNKKKRIFTGRQFSGVEWPWSVRLLPWHSAMCNGLLLQCYSILHITNHGTFDGYLLYLRIPFILLGRYSSSAHVRAGQMHYCNVGFYDSSLSGLTSFFIASLWFELHGHEHNIRCTWKTNWTFWRIECSMLRLRRNKHVKKK